MTSGVRKIWLGAAAVVVLAAGYSFLAWAAPARPISPDESANMFFAREVAERSRLAVPEPLNALVGGIIHPRSVRAVGDRLLPGGFIGWPVALGALGKAIGLDAVPYAAALLAALAVLAWGALVSRFFGRAVGFAAAALLAIQPVWWYWASRPYMPNAGFLVLLIGSLWFAVAAAFPRPGRWARVPFWAEAAVGGLLFAVTFAVRPAEAHWLALGGLLTVVLFRRALDWRRLAAFLAAAALGALPWLAENFHLYGSLLATGYGQDALGIPVDEAPQGGGARLLGALRPYLFPLGFAPRTALQRFWEYAVAGQPLWAGLVFAAFLLAFWRLLNADRRSSPDRRNALGAEPYRVAAILAAVSFWLVLYYGSYAVQDLPADGSVTLGVSYYRYWLPIFVVGTVPAAWAATVLGERLGRWRPAVMSVCYGLLAFASFWQVFHQPGSGLLALRATLSRQDGEVQAVLAATEPDAVIVCDQADKLLFPERRVITPLRSEATYEALGRLAGRVPLYYYGISLPPQDISFLRDVRLEPFGLGVETVRPFRLETLYRLPVVGRPDAL